MTRPTWSARPSARAPGSSPSRSRGYQYTRVNDDVVLTAIATGLIASVVFNMFQ
ncbi:MAG: RcnB family protein [Caulobacter sp.]|nr:RcnB family protein [Caulobacter sp.]